MPELPVGVVALRGCPLESLIGNTCEIAYDAAKNVLIPARVIGVTSHVLPTKNKGRMSSMIIPSIARPGLPSGLADHCCGFGVAGK
jgi:hypothetical protein